MVAHILGRFRFLAWSFGRGLRFLGAVMTLWLAVVRFISAVMRSLILSLVVRFVVLAGIMVTRLLLAWLVLARLMVHWLVLTRLMLAWLMLARLVVTRLMMTGLMVRRLLGLLLHLWWLRHTLTQNL